MSATSPLLVSSVYALLRVVRVKGVLFAESFRGAGPRVSPRSWADYVDHLGKIDSRRLRRLDARHQALSHVHHSDESFRWSKEVAGRWSDYIGHAQRFRVWQDGDDLPDTRTLSQNAARG